jgi:hypothetical protein
VETGGAVDGGVDLVAFGFEQVSEGEDEAGLILD